MISIVAVVVAGTIVFIFAPEIISWLIQFYNDAAPKGTPNKFIFTGPLDAFATRLKIATYGGIVLALPVWLWQLWRFITPGLNPQREEVRDPVRRSRRSSCSSMGGIVALLTLEPALKFLLNIGGSDLQPLLTADKYISLVSLMILAFGLSFEFPVILVFLLIARVLTTAQLRQLAPLRRGDHRGVRGDHHAEPGPVLAVRDGDPDVHLLRGVDHHRKVLEAMRLASAAQGIEARERLEAAARPSRDPHRRAGGAGRDRGHRRAGVVPAAEPRLRVDVDATRPSPRPPPSPATPRTAHRRHRPRHHGRTHHRAGRHVDALSSPGGGGVVRASFEAGRGFPLDRFQTLALDALDAGQSVLVAAPTGSGKTLVAEYAIAKARADGGKVFYTTPLKALSNQKYGDLVREHGSDAVGLLTGDNAVNGDAPIVVMTTEVLRNMIYAASPALDGLRYVVLDEVHYLQDRYRGPVWEEVIVHLPPEVDAGVPLGHGVERRRGGGVDRDRARQHRRDHRGAPAGHARAPLPGGGAGRRRRSTCCPRSSPPPTASCAPTPRPPASTPDNARDPRLAGPTAVAHAHARAGWRPPSLLAAEGMLPAICFVFSRKGCDQAVEQCLAAGLRLTEPGERDAHPHHRRGQDRGPRRRRPRRAALRPVAGRARGRASPPTTRAWCRR